MRIAYVTETYPPELNGVALGVERVVTYLRGRGHLVDLLRPAQRHERPGPAGAQEWLSAGCPIPVYPDLRFGLASVPALVRRLQAQQIELVHIATPGPLAWAAVRAARQLDLALSSDFRTHFHLYSRYYGLGLLAPLVEAGLRQLHKRTQRTFVPSRSAYRHLAARGFENLQLLGRGVDTERFSPAWRCEALRAEWQAGKAPVLLHVGRLAAEKNVELALRAHVLLSRARPDSRMIVVGDGPLRARLEKRYPAARFLGVLRGEALSRCYASADAFLFPSLSDTFGNVTLEAMASGLPVLAFNTAAAADLIVPRVNGFLATAGDDTAFLDGALRFASPPAAFSTLRTQARQTALQHHFPEVLSAFESALMQLCEQRPLAAALQVPAV
ncbi:glycosyltransferase family 4 protein [Roseateles sp. DB2]|uniref:glycosyltransferase family 4 protein n=1 Tax=Roseateles sp. DB2 TaxID=3453717 RepID=UPI003EEE1FBC